MVQLFPTNIAGGRPCTHGPFCVEEKQRNKEALTPFGNIFELSWACEEIRGMLSTLQVSRQSLKELEDALQVVMKVGIFESKDTDQLQVRIRGCK